MKKLFTSSGTLWSFLIAMVMMMAAQSAWAQYVELTALAGTGGEGRSEGYEKLVDKKDGRDGRDHSKWGQSFNSDNGDVAWIIVKASKAVVPVKYFLVIGNDTGTSGNRNWETYNIYAANFASDAEATYDSEGWVLVDERESANLNRGNYAIDNREFNRPTTTAYQYYKIVITKCVATSTYMQMEEWGLGYHDDFTYYLANPETGVDEPLVYAVVDGTSKGSLHRLFDGTSNTKWEGGFTNRANENDLSNGAYFIVKASRSICPTYYCLRTGGDTGSYPGRNWKKWRIYGMNATSNPARNDAGWTLIDSKAGIGRDQLPAANLRDCYFGMSEANETEYRYFKVEIDSIASGGYQQMDEFSFGDIYTLIPLRNNIVDAIGYDPDVFAEKTLVDDLGDIIDAMNASTDLLEIFALEEQATEQKELVNVSANQYAEFTTSRNLAIRQLADNNVKEEAVTYVQGWISDTQTIAPNDDYPCGNYAYLKATLATPGEEVAAEARRFLIYLLGNEKTVETSISTTYTKINGSGGFDGEEDDKLYDGVPRPYQTVNDQGEEETHKATKWCTNGVSPRTPAWTVFKTESPIKPTYYGLVTGNDTHTYWNRNWKTWKIWGANFEDDAEATRNADGWVLIDEKNNIGDDILHTDNEFESYIYLSEGCAVPYQYFKIEVFEAVSGDLIQMNEFSFYNQGNFLDYRQDFIDEFAEFNADSQPAYPGYIADFKAKYEELCAAASAPDLMSIKNQVQDLKDMILESVSRYETYEQVYDELLSTGPASEILEDWFTGYTSEKIGPNSMYLRGTHDYIMEGYVLNNEEIGQLGKPEDLNPGKYPASGEIGYIQNMIDALNENRYILLGGHTDDQWGDGFYGNLIDGVAINDTLSWKVEDGKQVPDKVRLATKWGGNAKGSDGTFTDTYIIFRTAEATNPYFYTLTTGNDTGTYTGRNWGSWFIYGANFAGDGDATVDADGWVLIDSKENTGQDRLHPVDCQPSFFGFSSETTEEYVYYKVVVTKAYSGTQIQMNELHFGTEEEFDEIRDEYADKAREFDYNVLAYQALIDAYDEKIDSIENCINMEVLFRLNAAVEALRPQITASKAVYARYLEAVNAAKTYLQENNLADSEAKTIFVNYLNTNEGPDDEEVGLYPNGTALYILETHELIDSLVNAEVEFLESLKAAAVAEGYGKGMDISSMIVNRTFAVASDTKNDEQGNALGREAEGWDGYIYRTATDSIGKIYGAEFCNYLAKFNVSQTLTGMKNGYYKVTFNAAYRSNGDLKSYNYAPFAYANDVQTFVPVIIEEAFEDSIDSWQGDVPDHKITYQDENGADVTVWGMWGCEGAAHAFTDGRYAITLVAKVTDGNLTFGVKNNGTKGNEWTAVGNFGLWYLGEDETDAAEALAEVAEYNAARINTLLDRMGDVYGDNYVDNPGFSADQRDALDTNSGVETYAAEKTIGETMQAIYEIKPAYAALYEAANKVYDKWEMAEINLFDAMEDEINIVRDNLDTGAYAESEAALATKADLYAHWPDYLELKMSNDVISASNIEIEKTNFEFTMEATGIKPWVELYKFYEALDEKEIVLAFDYTAEQDVENGFFYYLTPEMKSQPVVSAIPSLAAAEDWTTVYYNVSDAIEAYQFGSASDHGIRWYITYNNLPEGESLKLQARNFRFMTVAQVKAEGGKLLNGLKGDVNEDLTIDVADAQTVLILVADNSDDPKADVNGDGKVDVADVQTILIMIADQQ